MTPAPHSRLSSSWDAFWRSPSKERLDGLLAFSDEEWRATAKNHPWNSPPNGDGRAPNLCASAATILAIADHRKRHRTEKLSVRLRFGLDSLGEPPGKTGRPGHVETLSWGLALWDRLLACSLAPSAAEIERCAEALFHEDVWEHPEWHQDIQTILAGDGQRSDAIPLMERVFRAAALADPTLGLGAGIIAHFCSFADGRNRHMSKWEMILSREVGPLWDPMWRPEADGSPLWETMMRAPSRLGTSATGLLLHRIGEMPGSPLATDQALAESVVSALLSMGRKNLLAHTPKRARGWHARSIVEHWTGVEGATLGRAKEGSPDWMWMACARLFPFDEHPPTHTSKLAHPGQSGTLAERDATFQALEVLDRLGCDPGWVGPDGLCALDKMRALRGYETWVARFEKRILEQAAHGGGASSEARRL